MNFYTIRAAAWLKADKSKAYSRITANLAGMYLSRHTWTEEERRAYEVYTAWWKQYRQVKEVSRRCISWYG